MTKPQLHVYDGTAAVNCHCRRRELQQIVASFTPYTILWHTWGSRCLHGIGALPGAPHDFLELLVHRGKGLGLMG